MRDRAFAAAICAATGAPDAGEAVQEPEAASTSPAATTSHHRALPAEIEEMIDDGATAWADYEGPRSHGDDLYKSRWDRRQAEAVKQLTGFVHRVIDALDSYKATPDMQARAEAVADIASSGDRDSLLWIDVYNATTIALIEQASVERDRVAKLHSAEPADRSQLSDGYHTFAELYEHRHALFVALCGHIGIWEAKVWRAQQHNDGTMFPGWFVAGISLKDGRQITYHLPDRLWDKLDFAEALLRGPEWDGHTSADVVQRLYDL